MWGIYTLILCNHHILNGVIEFDVVFPSDFQDFSTYQMLYKLYLKSKLE